MEYIGLNQAIMQGIMTKLFDVVAHPDRSFRRRAEFGNYEQAVAINMINTATRYSVYFEQNYSSMQRKNQYRQEFWDLLPSKARIIHGIDAHSIEEMVEDVEFFRNH
jgi:histidinol phosphatase-like PHP family hydrolase